MASFDYTPFDIGEAQLEQCFGWASSFFDTNFALRENEDGLAPYIVEEIQVSERANGCFSMIDEDDVCVAVQGTSSLDMCGFVNTPRWADISRFARVLSRYREKQRESARAESAYIVETTARRKKATELFFDQGK